MFRLSRNKKGQNTVEYAVLIGLVVAVAVAMQTYVKRGIQGRFRDASDDYYTGLKSDANWGTVSTTAVTALDKKQYEPEYLSSQSTQQIKQDTETFTMNEGGTTGRTFTRETEQKKNDYQLSDDTGLPTKVYSPE